MPRSPKPTSSTDPTRKGAIKRRRSPVRRDVPGAGEAREAARHARVVLVEDDPRVRQRWIAALKRAGLEVRSFDDADDALACLDAFRPVVMFAQVCHRSSPGFALMETAQTRDPSLEVVLVSRRPSIAEAVRALRAGASHYLSARDARPAELRALVEAVMDRRAPVGSLNAGPISAGSTRALMCESEAMQALLARVGIVAKVKTPALITGETGTGKERVAETLHRLSPRSSRPLERVRCAASSDIALESEIFGHELHAVPGATTRRAGRLETADGGTVLLDEVSALPCRTQVKLLRALEGAGFERLGGRETLQSDVRLIAITSVDLEGQVRAGRFRADLYYRLSAAPIVVPPLRVRPADIEPLAVEFLRRLARKHRIVPPRLSPEATEALRRHDWPGNVRELQDTLERALVVSRGGLITPEQFGLSAVREIDTPATLPGMRTLTEIRREAVLSTYEACGRDLQRTADALSLGLRALQRRFVAYGVHSERERTGGGSPER